MKLSAHLRRVIPALAACAISLPASAQTSGTAQPSPPVQSGDSTDKREGQEWASAQVGGLTKEVDVELYGSTRATSPGGLVVVRWAFNSYEDQDERVRLRLELPAGWTLLDTNALDREFLLESWEALEGELRVVVPRDAVPGGRHTIRMSGLVVGEPGSAEVYYYVELQRRGGLKPGQVGVTGTVSLQSTSFALDTYDGARYGGVVDLSSRLTSRTTASINYRQGPREDNLTNYRIAQEDTRWSAMLRAPSFQLQAGNQLTSSGTAITGPFVRAQGASVRRTQGLFIGDLLAAQPTTFAGDAAGHIVRGSVGLNGPRGRLLAAVSDFSRPAGGYSTAPRYPEDISPESLEQLERERKALEQAARNRVFGAGLDGELRFGKVHRISARGGWMKLENSTGDTIDEPSTEVQYSLSHRRVNTNVRWRNMPTSLTGVHLPGDEMSFDGSVKLVGELAIAGRASRTLVETLGSAYRSENEGASVGLRYFRQGWRFDLRASQREWSYNTAPTVARTATLSFGVPIGPLSFNGFADVGVQDNGVVRRPASSYRGDLRWTGNAGSASWSASRYESLNAAPRLRTDVLGSLKLGAWEVSGGAWTTRGWRVGGDPGFWTQLGIPVSFDLLVTAGVEYAPRNYGQAPGWLGTLGVRKKLTLPIPFLRSRMQS